MTDTVTITREEYEDLIDAREAGRITQLVASGDMPTLSEAEMAAYIVAPTPLAFWRKARGLTQAALAEALGVAQPYVAQLETGRRVGDVRLYARLAKALKVRIEDLVPDEGGAA